MDVSGKRNGTSMQSHKDLFIIGGGINGAGIAADAAGRGLSVALCEKDDLASGTSSCSTKLIHGGLRYLEQYEFSLVRNALREREILMRKAPHLIQPLKFILPHTSQLRSKWLIRLGLFLYDYLAPRKLIPPSRSIDITKNNYGDLLLPDFKFGFSYYDCITDDARLVIENAIAAHEKGAEILTRTEFISAKREENYWKVTLKNVLTGKKFFFHAKALVNAAGPWVKSVNKLIHNNNSVFSIQLVKGSHIVVPKMVSEDFAYILQNPDKRVVFIIPYQRDFSLIGTTDVKVKEENHAEITEHEVDYLYKTLNRYCKKSLVPKNIIWSYSGIRCLQHECEEKAADITRDYKLLLTSENNALPLLTVIGGKLTSYRELAEEVMEKLKQFFPAVQTAWTAKSPLPGGNFKQGDFSQFFKDFRDEYHWLPEKIAFRYAHSYGSRVNLLLNNVRSLSDLGEEYGAGLFQKEIDYLMQSEWAKTTEDILWRRTKLGLLMSVLDQEKVFKLMSS